jgi:hypothetical protein
LTAGHDYAVGNGKPPLHTQFKKGQSGNPRGRPKRPRRSFEQEFNETLKLALRMKYARLATSDTNNCLSKLVQKLVTKAADGDLRAMGHLLSRMEMCDASDLLVDAEPEANDGQAATVSNKTQTTSAAEPVDKKKSNPTAAIEEDEAPQDVIATKVVAEDDETGSVTGSVTGSGTGSAAGSAAGNVSGAAEEHDIEAAAADEPPPVPPRPKRPRIETGGVVIQEGD